MIISAEPSLLDEPQAPACKQFLNIFADNGILVGDFYLLLGSAHKVARLPENMQLGPARQCYQNAGNLAMANPELTYCEGYAQKHGLFPMHHAWCLSANAEVIDPTWAYDVGNEYWGVALSTDFLLRQILETRTWGIFGEMLPKDVIKQRPETYLKLQWLPSSEQLTEFWAKMSKLQKTLEG